MESSLSVFAVLAVLLAPTLALPPPSGPLTANGTVSRWATTSTIATWAETGLNKLAKAAGKKYFGSATDNAELGDEPYVAGLRNVADFGQITPGNSMKWDATELSQGTFTFTKAEAIVSMAQRNGQLIRGHNCVWYSQLPSWVSNSRFDAAQLASVIQHHCETLVGHFRGQIYSWDVVNEPLNEDGSFRRDVFYETLGESYMSIALKAARAADPAAKLYINDYNIEGSGAKSTGMINLVRSLKTSDVPIDGIGVQGHLIVGQVPSTLKENLEAFTALGVEVAITELDIRMTLPATPALLAQQAKDYQTVISTCKAVAGCVGVTLWDYSDKYSWIPGVFSGHGAACPWDHNLDKKPAYTGIVDGWTY